jgi:hypothetical protein
MRRTHRQALVITLSATASVACDGSQMTRNPPPPPPPPPTVEPISTEPVSAEGGALEIASATDAGSAADSPTIAESGPVNLADYPDRLNGHDPAHGTIYRGYRGDGCYVRTPSKQPLPPGAMGPTRDVRCPATMQDPAWESCRTGDLYANAARDRCACFISGNPPPPPTRVVCPKR